MSYHAYTPPRSHFIDGQTGIAYGFEPIVTYVPVVTEWIQEKFYLKSPMIFKAPKIIEQWQLPFYYVQKDLRLNHDKLLRPKIEPFLRDY